MKKIEILAPAGGMDSVISAVRSGADAVYLGAKEFSARAGAENFDTENLTEAVNYCHIRGVLVYLTLNTVVFDSELEKAKDVIISSAKAGIDALIVQNMGIAMLAKRLVPDLPLHGSTQMSVHSLSGAKLLYEMGFKRVVLSRELSREEIKEIADNCPVELEVFVHGALCMSVSGQCYFSAVLGSRSGNRGRCAQPCRLPFSVDGQNGHALSLKDNSLIDYIQDLQSIGVTSAKIEGRMKRPEYVSAATTACVQQRDTGKITKENRDRLESVFSRTGFTDGYYKSKREYEMFGYRRKDDVVSATENLLSDIRLTYKDEAKRVEIKGEFVAKIGEKPLLKITDGTNTVEEYGDSDCEKALKKELDFDRCKEQLLKTGGTPYNFINLDLSLENGVTMPFSQINSLRRKALEKLSDIRKVRNSYKIADYNIPEILPHKAEKQKNYCRLTTSKIGSGFKKADLVFVPLFSNENELKSLVESGFNIAVEIPRALFSREDKVMEKLKVAKNLGINDVLCNSLASVYIAKNLSMIIHGGFGLNFVNTLDLQWAENFGFADTELSFELTFQQVEQLGGKLSRGIITYGFLPLMLTRNCPNKSKNIDCKVCKRQGKMQDRINKTFKFYCDGYGTEVVNTAVLDVMKKAEKLKSVDFQVFRFSVENSVEKVENVCDFFSYTLKSLEKTNGLYFRGIF
jgi:putative protease